jgi:hypothetical protein
MKTTKILVEKLVPGCPECEQEFEAFHGYVLREKHLPSCSGYVCERCKVYRVDKCEVCGAFATDTDEIECEEQNKP